MLYYFDNKKIRKNQAFVKHESYSFSSWGDDMIGNKELKEINIDNVYFYWSFESFVNLYYNDVEIASYGSRTNDFYGFGDSILSQQESIDNIVEKYNLKENDKLEIRVYMQPHRQCFFYTADGFRKVPNDWYINTEEVKAYYALSSDDRLHIHKTPEKVNFHDEVICIHRSTKDGFVIDKNRVEEIKKNLQEKHNLTISNEEIDLEK